MEEKIEDLFGSQISETTDQGGDAPNWIPYVPEDAGDEYDPSAIPLPPAPPRDGYNVVAVSLVAEADAGKDGNIYKSRKPGKIESVNVVVQPRIWEKGKAGLYLQRNWLSSTIYERGGKRISGLSVFMALIERPLGRGYDNDKIIEHARLVFAEAPEGGYVLGAKTRATAGWVAMENGLPKKDREGNKEYVRFNGAAAIKAESERQYSEAVKQAKILGTEPPLPYDEHSWYILTNAEGIEVVARAEITEFTKLR